VDATQIWRPAAMLAGQSFGSIARRVLIVIAYLLPAGLILHAILFWGHGIIDSEAMEFVLNYLLKRPFLVQIFDPAINDWGAYQARELSYVFDFIDARVFAVLLDHGMLVFVPLSGVLGLFILSAIYVVGARKVFCLSGTMTSMLLALFVSCIVVQASTPILYRSSKIILSVALLTFLFCTSWLLKVDKRRITWGKGTTFVFLGVLMSLSDRQGFYYLISTTGILLALWSIAKFQTPLVARTHLYIISMNIGAIAVVVCYNRILAPQVIHALNGYWPNFSYQNLPWSKLLDPTLLPKAWSLFQQQISFFFGNIPFVALVVVAVIAPILIGWQRPNVIKRHMPAITASFISIAAILGLLAVMVARHPPVYSVRDHSYWYYTLTIPVIILFGLSVWLSFLSADMRAKSEPFLYLVIAILIASNLLGYTQQRQVMINSTGWFADQHATSQALVAQFAVSPPNREQLLLEKGDLFLDDRAHFLENVERAYLHLRGASSKDPMRDR
jgi:hypothetical protein